MPELSIVYASWCESNERYEKQVEGKSGKYLVRFGPTIGGSHAYDYTCSCPAFQYGKCKYCKHIEAVKDERCCWNHDVIMGSFEEEPTDKKCPKCGGNLLTVKVGV